VSSKLELTNREGTALLRNLCGLFGHQDRILFDHHFFPTFLLDSILSWIWQKIMDCNGMPKLWENHKILVFSWSSCMLETQTNCDCLQMIAMLFIIDIFLSHAWVDVCNFLRINALNHGCNIISFIILSCYGWHKHLQCNSKWEDNCKENDAQMQRETLALSLVKSFASWHTARKIVIMHLQWHQHKHHCNACDWCVASIWQVLQPEVCLTLLFHIFRWIKFEKKWLAKTSKLDLQWSNQPEWQANQQW